MDLWDMIVPSAHTGDNEFFYPLPKTVRVFYLLILKNQCAILQTWDQSWFSFLLNNNKSTKVKDTQVLQFRSKQSQSRRSWHWGRSSPLTGVCRQLSSSSLINWWNWKLLLRSKVYSALTDKEAFCGHGLWSLFSFSSFKNRISMQIGKDVFGSVELGICLSTKRHD